MRGRVLGGSWPYPWSSTRSRSASTAIRCSTRPSRRCGIGWCSPATVITPNLAEAELLAGVPVARRPPEELAQRLLALGPPWVLVKGGHRTGDPVDVLLGPARAPGYAGERIDNRTRTARAARGVRAGLPPRAGRSVPDAVAAAKAYVTGAIRHGFAFGAGIGPTEPPVAAPPAAGLRPLSASLPAHLPGEWRAPPRKVAAPPPESGGGTSPGKWGGTSPGKWREPPRQAGGTSPGAGVTSPANGRHLPGKWAGDTFTGTLQTAICARVSGGGGAG